ncbi:DUF3299 domain-containing protein [Oceanomicrobium pacificus]|uniref:DUF3299 domain-containing protein n=1 Tax=Oceanomicrobium pacificus TaxID=2692916 RepID=A0A6B0U549_9RHOB|nr:DUF3299 domain-containing protein [Oceanomicrobium pacificus]MXU66061.1 DUF3299 domain-containing protein [Oceanomicrobium pacificus]
MRHILSTIVVVLGVGPLHAEPTPIDWPDLIDQSVQSYEDPFLDLDYEQVDDLRRVVTLQAELDGGKPSPETGTQLEKVKAELSAQGIDADWLISQRGIVAERRELASAAGNVALDGETITLGGFAIPAPPDEDGSAMAYLVPERGMCSHVPPPPPNQMVRLRLSDGWAPARIHEPIVLTGRINIDPSDRQMMVVDGFISMNATFSMDVHEVQTFGQSDKAEAPATNDWAKSLADGFQTGAKSGVTAQ